ncbi:MAG: response regulator transcription factor [Candidatus Rokubacteria bacterium]|nr:response regulator transcription factor [Candidatus Rokubacteria bacterium]
MQRCVTVAVADGNRGTRQGLIRRLGRMPDISVVGEAGDPAEALRVVSDRRPDVVVLDLRRLAPDGTEFLGRLAEAAAPTRIVVLTAYVRDEERAELTRAGARAVLLKEIDSEALARTIRAVALQEAGGGRRAEA